MSYKNSTGQNEGSTIFNPYKTFVYFIGSFCVCLLYIEPMMHVSGVRSCLPYRFIIWTIKHRISSLEQLCRPMYLCGTEPYVVINPQAKWHVRGKYINWLLNRTRQKLPMSSALCYTISLSLLELLWVHCVLSGSVMSGQSSTLWYCFSKYIMFVINKLNVCQEWRHLAGR